MLEEQTHDEGRLIARRYRLGETVGRGGMGTVFAAHDELLGRDVAVKEVVLPFGLTDEERETQYKRTFREARTAARLGHPGVVTVYDVVEEDGRPWIVMELIQTRNLDQVIKQDGPLHWGRAASIGRQMLGALHAAHEAGVQHRDVKPSNVLLAEGDRAVITDFGIAHATGDVTLTTTGLVMGSPAYIAPERARGRTTGPPSDLWSLGVTLYAMVGGKSPFERVEPMASLVAIISEDPAPCEAAGPLWKVIDGLLRKDPDERMTAQEAGLLLDKIVRGEASEEETQAVSLRSEAPKGSASGRTSRTTLVWSSVAAVAVLAIGAAVAAFNLGGTPTATRTHAPGPVKPAVSASSHTAPTTASPSPSPSHSAVALPADFKLYKGPGFSVGVPTSWQGPVTWPGGPSFLTADRNSRVVFKKLPDTTASAVEVMAARQTEALSGKQGVTIQRQGAATGLLAAPGSSDLEYLWNANAGQMHILERTVVANGHAYAITLQLPVATWDQQISTLAPILTSFAPSP